MTGIYGGGSTGRVRYGTAAYTGRVSSGVTTILLPARNTNGATLRTVSISHGGSNRMVIFIDTKAPRSFNDHNCRGVIASPYNGDDAAFLGEFEVPVGYGIFFASETSGSGNCTITYDLL